MDVVLSEFRLSYRKVIIIHFKNKFL